MGSRALVQSGLYVLAILAAGTAGIVLPLVLRSGPAPASAGMMQPQPQQAKAVPEAVFSCGACHGVPPPTALPKGKWASVIAMMKERIDAYGLTPAPTEEQIKLATEYFVGAAPESLAALPVQLPASTIEFAQGGFGRPPDNAGGRPPVIGDVAVVDLDRNGKPEVLACDTGAGLVYWIAPAPDGSWMEQPIGRAPFPARAEAADLDRDGIPEIVIASLGSLQPTDEAVGAVFVSRNDGRGTVSCDSIASGLPRTCDVRPADLDGDGDVDIAVAEFGMYTTGAIAWLERTAAGTYQHRVIERISGASHVPVGDMDGDGKPDIVALVSQHHERVVVAANKGGGEFVPRVVYQAPHPLWGCSGVEIVDLNKDGRPDILFTNGDALDFDTSPKPYHGVQWLENLGGLKFVYRDIVRFHGAYRAVASDLDGDNDLDIVVASMATPSPDERVQSLVWLENDGKQNFTARGISNSPSYLVSLAVGDFSGDSRPDILAGGMYIVQPYGRVGRMTLWTNKGKAR